MPLYKSNYTTEQIELAIANGLAGGSPSGTYADLAALAAAIPEGNTNICITLDNGYWNYWNGIAWTAGAAYTSSAAVAAKQDKIDLLTAEAVIADDDNLAFFDKSAATHRKSTWANIKAVLKTYFDALYTTALVVLTGYSKPESTSAIGGN